MVPLVKSERTLFVSTAPSPPDAPPSWLHWYLGIGLVVGGLAAAAGGGAAARGQLPESGLALLLIAWGMVVGSRGQSCWRGCGRSPTT